MRIIVNQSLSCHAFGNHGCKRREPRAFIYSVCAFVYSPRLLVLFVFATLVLFFGSLVVHCSRIFVLRVRFLFYMSNINLCMLVIFASVLYCTWLVRFTVKTFRSLLFLVFRLDFAAVLKLSHLFHS